MPLTEPLLNISATPLPMPYASDSLLQAWDLLPAAITSCVLHHSALPESRMQAGLAALDLYSAGQKNLLPLATDLLLSVWECQTHDISMVRQLWALHEQFPFLTHPQKQLFTALLQKPPSSLHALPDSPAPALAPLAHWHKALHYFEQEYYDQALSHCAATARCWPGSMELEGHCLLHLGRREEAFALWRTLLQQRPWHVQLLLTLHDHMRAYDQPLDFFPEQRGHRANTPFPLSVLLYSWNKAEELNATLQALDASLPSISRIVCLNNGSTDGTVECMNIWSQRWGQRFIPVHLPVNVGAAAARNWLAALPAVQELPYAAYVDDDVLLPPHWLGHMARALEVQPRASAWGCRIMEARQPHMIQSGPLHLTLAFNDHSASSLPGQAQGSDAESAEVAFSPFRAQGEPFSVTTMPPACPHHDRWNFIRSCASVTGCCHLFRTADLQGEGGFSLSLSPSQYDDLERDLRSLRQGKLACYTGFCGGLHAKNTGQSQNTRGGINPAAFGNGLGNKYKLHGMFSPEDILAMARHESAALYADIREKLDFLDSKGMGTAES